MDDTTPRKEVITTTKATTATAAIATTAAVAATARARTTAVSNDNHHAHCRQRQLARIQGQKDNNTWHRPPNESPPPRTLATTGVPAATTVQESLTDLCNNIKTNMRGWDDLPDSPSPITQSKTVASVSGLRTLPRSVTQPRLPLPRSVSHQQLRRKLQDDEARKELAPPKPQYQHPFGHRAEHQQQPVLYNKPFLPTTDARRNRMMLNLAHGTGHDLTSGYGHGEQQQEEEDERYQLQEQRERRTQRMVEVEKWVGNVIAARMDAVGEYEIKVPEAKAEAAEIKEDERKEMGMNKVVDKKSVDQKSAKTENVKKKDAKKTDGRRR
ncbi:hypothetical protein B0T17DRAFT_106780 [Bombardia bombarda]|uniref:Uncharacterized protein n=1 Tax=Bombardia bombarda TaxID=252184 RepID=A0AA39XNK0_9PEZI|nr:hypothetical protein B0T17DRAFT_106780 [Bombardia bombarda]